KRPSWWRCCGAFATGSTRSPAPDRTRARPSHRCGDEERQVPPIGSLVREKARTAMGRNSFGAEGALTVGGDRYRIFRLDALASDHDVARLPYSIKILLEN